MGGAVLDQLVARALLARAATILPVRRELLRTQRDALVGAVREHLPGARFRVPDGGLCLWVELDEPVASALATAAEAYGVRLAPGPRFGTEGTFERYLRLPFARPANELVEAVRRIAAARADLDALPPGRPATPAVVA
jgi:DNA-binding transcriptional MocR family regulator